MAQHDQEGIMRIIERFTKSVVYTLKANNIEPEPHAVVTLVKTMFEEYYGCDALNSQQEHEQAMLEAYCIYNTQTKQLHESEGGEPVDIPDELNNLGIQQSESKKRELVEILTELKNLGIQQKDVAEALGISTVYLSYMKNGKRPVNPELLHELKIYAKNLSLDQISLSQR